MKKKLISLLTACLLALCLLPVQAFANEVVSETTIYHSDGSYSVIRVIKETSARAAKTVTGGTTESYYSDGNVLQWKAVLDATFTYNGSSATCTSVNSLNVTVYDSSWSVGSKSTSRSGNTAYGYLTMERRIAGGTQGVPVTLTLTCDRNGNLS